MSEPQITPLARRLAEENGVNWRSLAGSGPNGIIVERDILAYLAKVMVEGVTPAPAPAPSPPMPKPQTSSDFDFDIDLFATQELPPAPSEPSPATPSGSDPAPAPAEPKLEAREVPSAPAPALSWEPVEPSIPPAPPWPLPSEPTRPELAVAEAEPAAAPALAPAAARVQLRQRLVNPAPAREAAVALSEAWHQEVSLAALLYRAADKALADLELGREPLKGEFAGDTLKSYRAAPAHTLRGTLENLAAAHEAADGLVVLAFEGGDVVVFPGAEMLTLSQPSEGQALLSYSGGLDAAKAAALLERVGYYLERPILLA